MKNLNIKIVVFAVVVAGITSLTSCEKYLDVETKSTTSQNAVFESTSYTNTAIIGVYRELVGDDVYGQRLSIFNPLMADDFRPSGNYSGAEDQRAVAMFAATSTNSGITRPFERLYSGIERANNCIKYIPASNLYNSGTEEQKKLMRTYYGEALTLRAQFYYELIRNWGDVPAPMVPAADLPSFTYEHADRDETYDKILADLELAATLVPWRSASGYGSFRWTKGAIKGLRARIALARAGYSLRNDTKMMERRTDSLTYYQIAFDECKEIMNNRAEHSLNPSFENVFKSIHSSTRQDNEHELMFEVAAYGGNSSTDSKLGFANGLRYEAGSAYGSSNGGVLAIPTYFYEFDQIGDSRRDVTIAPYIVTAATNKKILTPVNFYQGKFRKSWTAFDKASTAQTYAINWPMVRFADILLMFAEADNVINNGPSIDAQNALKEVRERAFVGHLDRMPAIPTDKKGFFGAIVQERLLEFGGEGIRKYDLIRWNLINGKFIETRNKLTEFMNGTGAYANVPEEIYYKENPFSNLTTARNEFLSINLYGAITPTTNGQVSPTVALFQPTPTAPASSEGYSKISWRKAVTEEDISGTGKGFATFFEPNKKELFPYPFDALSENPSMKQNFGYIN